MGFRAVAFALVLMAAAEVQAQEDPSVQKYSQVLTLVDGTFDMVRKPEGPFCERDGISFNDQKTYEAFRHRTLRPTVTLAEAKSLFAELKANPEIPFGYPSDGCQARASAMARILERKGIYSRKLFVSGRLQAASPCEPGGRVNWGTHVAPLVTVVMPDGSKTDMVIDPSIEKDVALPERWIAGMNRDKGSCRPLPANKLASHSMDDANCAYIITERFVDDFPESAEYLHSFKNFWDADTLLNTRVKLGAARTLEAECKAQLKAEGI